MYVCMRICIHLRHTHIRDLRGINPGGEAFWTLFSTVEEFKDKVRDDFPSAPWTSQYVTRDATLEDVLRKMSTESIHRVFVVDSEANKRPVDVITMTDVMTFLLNQLTKLNPVREGARVGRQRVGQRKNVGWR